MVQLIRSRWTRRRARTQSGVTLMELLIVIGITGMVLVPVMAWSITALNRESNQDVDADTAAFAQLSNYLVSDVARSTWGASPAPSPGFCGDEAGSALLRVDYDREDPKIVSYLEVDTGKTDSGTGQALSEIVRRTCTAPGDASAVTDEMVIADQVVQGSINVTCKDRPKFAVTTQEEGNPTPDPSAETADPCGQVTMTLKGVYGPPVTLRATRQVDPEPDPEPGSRPTPVISCSPACPASGYRPLTISFDGTLSSDRDPGGVTGWAWDFGDDTDVVATARATHTYTRVGTFTVTLSVSNAAGGVRSMTTTVTVRNASPVAIATPNPITAFRLQPVQFNGGNSYDPDGEVAGTSLSYLWDFGDLTPTASDPNPSHSYGREFIGRRNASLEVSDNDPDDPLTSTVDIPVDVQNNPPKVELSSDPLPVPCDELNPAAGDCIRVTDFPIEIKLKATTPGSGAIGATDVDGDVWPSNYKWDIRRKGSQDPYADPRLLGTGSQLAFTFRDNGVFTVSLEVTDNDGGRTIRTIEVVVNKRPTADATPKKCSINVGQPAQCTFDASASNDPDGELVSYQWDWGDGTVDTYSTANGNLEDGIEVTHTWDPRPALGTSSTVTLTVTDNDGTVAHLALPVKINIPPVPVINTFDPATETFDVPVYRKKQAVFAAVHSTDPDGDDATNFTANSYAWDFGDGTTGTGHTPAKTYNALGTYHVTLTATDADGGVATTDTYITVINQPPIASIQLGTPYVNGGAPYSFAASSSSYDPDGTISSYVWKVDGVEKGTGTNFNYDFPGPGRYQLSLTVTDNNGATDTETRQIKVNLAPIANFTTDPTPPYSLTPNFLVKFDASSSSDPDGLPGETSLYYTWKIKPVAAADWTYVSGRTTTPNFQYTFVDRDQYTVQLVVDDNQGGVATKTVTALVGINKLPIVQLTADKPTGAINGQNVRPATWTFDPAGTNDPDGTIASYTWNFGDGTAPVSGSGGALAALSHTFNNYGKFTVRLTVVDNMGGTSYKELIVKVNQKPIAKILPASPVQLAGGRGTEISFDGVSGSSDPDGDALAEWDWDWGDGNTSSGGHPTHTWDENGLYTIRMRVKDGNNPGYWSDWVERQIEIDNSPPVAQFTHNRTETRPGVILSNDPPYSITFDASSSYDPDGTIQTYDWDWGDGTAHGTGVNPTHSFASYGTFTVKLTVTDDSNLTDEATIEVIINRRPVAVIEVVSGYPCGATPPCTITFTAQNSHDDDPGGFLDGPFRWEVSGVGVVKNGIWATSDKTLTYTFTNVGTTNLTLTVGDDQGQAGSVIFPVQINRPPIADFAITPSSAAINSAPFTFSFNGGSPFSIDPDGTIASYSWDFGDGTTATGPTATHTYASENVYPVTLTVVDNMGVPKSRTKTVKANKAPVPKIGPTVLDPKLGLDFQFDGSGSSDPDGTITAYLWDFGDGTTSTEVSPVHVYSANGPYTVKLTVTDENNKSASTTRSLTVAPNVDPLAAFETDPANGRGDGAPVEIGFDASTSVDPDGSIVSYGWDFGDGTTGTGKTTTHTYSDYGGYTATLTVTDNNGATDVTSKPIVINQVPIPSIQTFPNPPVYQEDEGPYVFDFFAELSVDPDGAIAGYDWDFGDGETGTGILATHTYESVGVFTVTLTVTDNLGATASTTVDVKVNQLPHVDFVYSPSDPVREADVNFEATGTYDDDGEILTYQWSFGDGYAGTGRTTSHVYKEMGTFDVTLTAVDDNGGESTVVKQITVGNAAPVAQIISNPSPPVIGWDEAQQKWGPLQVWGDYSYDTDGTIVSYEWDFGDGATDTGAAPAPHYYDDYGSGFEAVYLTVTDDMGVQSTDLMLVTLNKAPVVVMGPTSGLTRGIEFQFTSEGTYDPEDQVSGEPLNYYWSFGDGTNASGPSPKHTYSAAGGLGPVTITLTVTDSQGFKTTVSRNVLLINQPPVAHASAERVLAGEVGGDPTGPAPLEIEFSGASSGDPDGSVVGYQWDWGDGTSSTTSSSPTARHTYTGVARTVTVKLTVTDNNGGTGTTTMPIVITTNRAPVASFWVDQKDLYGGTAIFHADDSWDPDGTIVSYSWDFDTQLNDPNDLDTGVEVTRNLPVGYWHVKLTVTDNSGATATATDEVYMRGSLPPPTLSQSGSGTDFTWNDVPGAVQYRIWSTYDGTCLFNGAGNDSKTVDAPTHSVHLSLSEPFGCSGTFQVQMQVRNYGADEWSVVSNKVPYAG